MGGVTKSRTSFFLVTGLLVFVSAIVLTIVVVVGNNKDKKNEQQLRGNDEVPTKPPIPEEDGLNDISQPVSRSTYIQTTMTSVLRVYHLYACHSVLPLLLLLSHIPVSQIHTQCFLNCRLTATNSTYSIRRNHVMDHGQVVWTIK